MVATKVLGKKVSESVAHLQDLYLTKGTSSEEFAKYLRPFVLFNIARNVKGFPEELVQYTFDRIYDRISPKKDTEGKLRCFYYSPVNGDEKPGYDPTLTNLGSYLISVIRWSCYSFFYHENKIHNQLLYNEELENYDKPFSEEEMQYMNLKFISFDNTTQNSAIRKMAAWMQTSGVN